ncbi:sulfurtransferase complex subunit TusB [Aliiglaciecola lipolytica]|uniref:Protein tusB n=1 Tax=Aliiglaciecola lipolytica E3 TaxID=1127673 RepID=K6YFG5_9ALTE|nr:sulfurtransferase complex subunit TusB [Aliiglaciecola lipolytica]GAC15353.1 protein tusB [Aliiglaciecola lipolytica E3]
MILHKLSHSPYSQKNFVSLLTRITDKDGILLTQDATYALSSTEYCQLLLKQTVNVYALEPDTIARGIQPVMSEIQLVDYAEFVTLALKYNNVISW